MRLLPFLIAALCIGSCNSFPEDTVQRYDNQVIEQIILNTDSSYTIQIGIMAQAFSLDKDHEDLNRQLGMLRESLENRSTVNVEVEKGTARIRRVEK